MLARARLQPFQGQAGEKDPTIYTLKDVITPMTTAKGTSQKGSAKGWCSQPGTHYAKW